MLKTDHEVIRRPTQSVGARDHEAFAGRMTLSPLVDPQIENVVQEHVGQQR
ncbi:MAG: hypothetical protein O3C40_20825 [Planctomycetota bacterium]|nr:hypothetical protein [Planctomycetota bacterium]